MVRRLLFCGAMALLLGWGTAAQAGDPAAAPGCSAQSCDAQKPAHPVMDWMKSCVNCGFWSNHDEFISANTRTEASFLFGSSRDFFNEPTLKGPPYPAYPVYPSYQYSKGYPGCKGYENSPEYPCKANPNNPSSAKFYPSYSPYPPATPYPQTGK